MFTTIPRPLNSDRRWEAPSCVTKTASGRSAGGSSLSSASASGGNVSASGLRGQTRGG